MRGLRAKLGAAVPAIIVSVGGCGDSGKVTWNVPTVEREIKAEMQAQLREAELPAARVRSIDCMEVFDTKMRCIASINVRGEGDRRRVVNVTASESGESYRWKAEPARR